MAKLKGCDSEMRVSGKMAVGGEVVLGRVRFFDESYTEGAILCVRDGERIDRETLSLCPPIAVIVFGYDVARCLGELCSLGVPCMVLDEDEVHYALCKNKVALIDSERGILTLDPSLDTLELYSSLKARGDCQRLDCAVGGVLESAEIANAGAHRLDYYFAPSSALGEDIPESAITLWERLCPELLVIDVTVPQNRDGDERKFCESVESIFKAALYGSLAISLSGFDCESDLAYAMRLLHKTFCMLESEGREFNAYLPRGVLLSSPLWLMSPSPVTNPDFLILDLDLLLPSLFSLTAEQIIKKEKALKKELFSLLERYFVHFSPRCDIYLKTKRFVNTPLLRELVRLANVKVVFS